MNTHQKEQQYRKAQRRVRNLNRHRLDNLQKLFKPRTKITHTTGLVGVTGSMSWYEPKPKWSTV